MPTFMHIIGRRMAIHRPLDDTMIGANISTPNLTHPSGIPKSYKTYLKSR